MQVRQADSLLDIDRVRRLFEEYAAAIRVDLCFQQFDQELAGLPGKYLPPEGCLLLAVAEDKDAGCVGLRKLDEGICEMKRLYVRPAFRGHGVGRRLATEAIARAQRTGYLKMRLDTLPVMKEAIALYRSLGFGPAQPYYDTPLCGTLFMELDLRSTDSDRFGPQESA